MHTTLVKTDSIAVVLDSHTGRSPLTTLILPNTHLKVLISIHGVVRIYVSGLHLGTFWRRCSECFGVSRFQACSGELLYLGSVM